MNFMIEQNSCAVIYFTKQLSDITLYSLHMISTWEYQQLHYLFLITVSAASSNLPDTECLIFVSGITEDNVIIFINCWKGDIEYFR